MSICLNMIVKNESKTLPKLFESLHEVIDYYVILDTGSDDGTPDLIKSTMKKYNIEGEVFHSEWVNFAVCRNRALKHAINKADYALIIDADESLHYLDKNFFTNLTEDCYFFKRKYSNIEYYLPALLNISENNKLEWKWEGPVHNFLTNAPKHNITKEYVDIDKVWIKSTVHGGSKSHNVTPSEKYLRDAQILEEELKKNPNDARSQYYLAQSYKDAGENEKAILHYKKRVEMKGWEEEVYYSLYSIGLCKQRMGCDFESEVLHDYLRAFTYRSTRLEALYEILFYYRNTKADPQKAFGYGMLANALVFPTDKLFVDTGIHRYKFLDELSIAAYQIGFYLFSYKLMKKILEEKHYPDNEHKRLSDNFKFATDKLLE